MRHIENRSCRQCCDNDDDYENVDLVDHIVLFDHVDHFNCVSSVHNIYCSTIQTNKVRYKARYTFGCPR